MINNKQVCMIVHQDYYRDGRVRQYAEALAARGISVDIICTKHIPIKGYHYKNITVHPIPIFHEQAGLVRLFFEYILGIPLYSVLLVVLYFKNKYKIIHIHNMPDFLVFCALIPKICGAKIILDIHDPMPEFFQSKTQKPPTCLLVRALTFFEKISAAFAHHLITANPLFKKNLIKRGIPEEKITVILNQPNPEFFVRQSSKVIKEDEREKPYFTLIFPGTIAPRYNLEFAVRALPILKNDIPNIRLLIIGPESSYYETLHQLADELKVKEHLEIKPPLPIEEIPNQLEQADIGIYTALPDAHMDIAIPGKVVEYAVMGLPIVASRLTILTELFPEDAILFFEPGNLEEFCENIRKLYQQPQLRLQLIENIDNSYLKHHSYAAEVQKYIALLENFGLSNSGG